MSPCCVVLPVGRTLKKHIQIICVNCFETAYREVYWVKLFVLLGGPKHAACNVECLTKVSIFTVKERRLKYI